MMEDSQEKSRKTCRAKITAEEQSAILADIWEVMKKYDLSVSGFIRMVSLANQRRGS